MSPTIRALGQARWADNPIVLDSGFQPLYELSIRWDVEPATTSGFLVQRIQRDAKVAFSTLPTGFDHAGVVRRRPYRVEFEDYWECWIVVRGLALPFKLGHELYALGDDSPMLRDQILQDLVFGEKTIDDLPLPARVAEKRDHTGRVNDVFRVMIPAGLDGTWSGTWKMRGTVYFLDFHDPWLQKFSLAGRSEGLVSAGRLFSVDAVRLAAPPSVEPVLVRSAAGHFERRNPEDRRASILVGPREVEGHWNFQHGESPPATLRQRWDSNAKAQA